MAHENALRIEATEAVWKSVKISFFATFILVATRGLGETTQSC